MPSLKIKSDNFILCAFVPPCEVFLCVLCGFACAFRKAGTYIDSISRRGIGSRGLPDEGNVDHQPLTAVERHRIKSAVAIGVVSAPIIA